MDDSSKQEIPSQAGNAHQAYHEYNDEIDLLEILQVLFAKRRIIILAVSITTLLAIAYALLAQPVYKGEVFLLPPLASDVEGLNHPDINDYKGTDRRITVESVYSETVKNLQSLSLRRQFFDEQELADKLDPKHGDEDTHEKIFQEEFHEHLNVHRGNKEKSDFVTVSLEGHNPRDISLWLNEFVPMVNTYTVDSLAEAVETEVSNKKRAITEKIEGLRQTAASRRRDRIVILREQLHIAEKLGLRKRNDGAAIASTQSRSPEMEFSINTTETPLYLRGTEELQAEIEILEKRKNDDPFINNLRNLQEDLARLEKISINRNEIKAVQIDRMAVQPEEPIKPKKKLVVLMGVLIGLMLGFLAAFFANYIDQNRDRI